MRIEGKDQGSLLAAQALAGVDPAHHAAERLESLFATLLVKEMRATQNSGLFGEGTSADVYGGWFDQFLGEVLARRGELRLAQPIERSLAAKEGQAP